MVVNVRNQFLQKGILLRDNWIEQTLQHIQQHQPINNNIFPIDKIFAHFLCSDICHSSHPCIPNEFNNIWKGLHILQMEEILNICSSNFENNNKKISQNPKLLRMKLNDGQSIIHCLIFSNISNLDLHLEIGSKIALKNVTVRRGYCILTHFNTKVMKSVVNQLLIKEEKNVIKDEQKIDIHRNANENEIQRLSNQRRRFTSSNDSFFVPPESIIEDSNQLRIENEEKQIILKEETTKYGNAQWICERCTYANNQLNTECDMCHASKNVIGSGGKKVQMNQSRNILIENIKHMTDVNRMSVSVVSDDEDIVILSPKSAHAFKNEKREIVSRNEIRSLNNNKSRKISIEYDWNFNNVNGLSLENDVF